MKTLKMSLAVGGVAVMAPTLTAAAGALVAGLAWGLGGALAMSGGRPWALLITALAWAVVVLARPRAVTPAASCDSAASTWPSTILGETVDRRLAAE